MKDITVRMDDDLDTEIKRLFQLLSHEQKTVILAYLKEEIVSAQQSISFDPD